MRMLLALALVSSGCSDAAQPEPAAGPGSGGNGSGTGGAFGGRPVERALVFRTYQVAAVTNDHSVGFDLDDLVSTDSTADGCGQADATSPDGTLGIDNGVGRIWPAFFDVLGDSLESLFREGVSRGGEIPLLVLPVASNAQFAVARLEGAAVDFDGLLAGFQTFDLEAAGQPFPVTQTPDRVLFGPAPAVVQVEAFSLAFALPIDGLRGALHRDDDGVWRGVVGGSFPLASVPAPLAAVVSLSSGQPLADLLPGAGDLPDSTGACRRISFAATVEAVEGFAVAPTSD